MLAAIRRCYASLFTDRAIRYRIENGFDHLKVFNSAGVMKMVRSEIATSGVIFTIDTDLASAMSSSSQGHTVWARPWSKARSTRTNSLSSSPLTGQERGVYSSGPVDQKETKLVYARGGEKQTTRLLPVDRKDRERFCVWTTRC